MVGGEVKDVEEEEEEENEDEEEKNVKFTLCTELKRKAEDLSLEKIFFKQSCKLEKIHFFFKS